MDILRKLLEMLIIAFTEWIKTLVYLIYAQYRSIGIILSDPSSYNIQEGLYSLLFWIPLDIMFIGIPLCLIYLTYRLCKKYFKHVAG